MKWKLRTGSGHTIFRKACFQLVYSRSRLWKSGLVRITENGLMEIKVFKGNRADFSFFLKSDSNIEGGYKLLRFVMY
ncbi:unnamed protein product [Caenorhabditis angaria]|uniref:Uncharacterized protein n=1 Tax=Caenorhabditis angaria TaxID=860376 RepID=A0A9P1IE73_9PELO|nr:unnamed protein product [Caenorhabditis angaria]